MARHKDLTGAEAIHPAAYIQGSDPGAVGARKFWIDNSGSEPYPLYARNDANDGWVEIGTAGSGGGGSSAAADITITDTAGDFTATNVEDALAELQSDIEAHIADSTDAHNASAISIADSGNDFDATNVEGALAELQADHEADVTALATHEADTTNVHGITDTANLYRVGGTDVPVSDGGTGASSAAGARANLGLTTGQLFLSAAGMWPRITNPPSNPVQVESGTNNYYVIDFDASTAEHAQVVIVMPSDWDGGTVTAKFYWTHAGGSGNVVWAINGVAVDDGDVLTAALGFVQTVTDAAATTAALHISDSTSSMTIRNPAGSANKGGDMVVFNIYRDATNGSDTFAGDARLIGAMITYTRT